MTRRQALLGASALAASAGLAAASNLGRSAAAATLDHAHEWGRIANHGHRDERIITGLFFAGPSNPNSLPLYTRQPLDKDRLDWSDQADIMFALQQITQTGLNTIKLSYWGHDGETDVSGTSLLFSQQRWPGEGPGTYTEAEQVAKALELFRAAERLNLLVAPLLEVSAAFPFWADFPNNLDGLVSRAGWLLRNFGDEPSFLRVYDRSGHPRHAVFLIETIHPAPIDPRDFAAGFDRAAEILQQETGYRVGFFADPTPLPPPPIGSHNGPDPDALRETSSILGINPFNITSQGLEVPPPGTALTEQDRLAYARSIMSKWSSSQIPFIAPIIPGYDAHIVFEGSDVYGYNDEWLRQEKALAVEFGVSGLCMDYWNGYTEGAAIPPTEEDGRRHQLWVCDIIAALRLER